jgi:hypothetical protein
LIIKSLSFALLKKKIIGQVNLKFKNNESRYHVKISRRGMEKKEMYKQSSETL